MYLPEYGSAREANVCRTVTHSDRRPSRARLSASAVPVSQSLSVRQRWAADGQGPARGPGHHWAATALSQAEPCCQSANQA